MSDSSEKKAPTSATSDSIPWKKRIGPIFLKILIISAITFVLGEITLNIWLFKMADEQTFEKFAQLDDILARKPMRYKPHPYMSYTLRPDYEKDGTRHDKLGFRGPRAVTPKKADVFRLVTMGGSTTYTEFVDDDRETYPAQLEKSLREMGYKNIEVINAGVPGHTSFETLANLQFRVLDIQPDLIVNFDCLNDAHTRFVKPRRYRSDNTGYRQSWVLPGSTPWYEKSAFLRVVLRLTGVWPEGSSLKRRVIRRSSQRWRRLPTDEAREVLRKNPPTYFKRNLESMIAISRSRKIGIMFATYAYNPKSESYIARKAYQEAVGEQNRVLQSLERTHNVPVYGFHLDMPGASCPDCWIDGRHVTAKGARMQGKFFADFIHKNGLIPAQFNTVSK